MKESHIQIKDYCIDVYRLNTVVVGTGAAGYNAADRLHQFGQKDIAIVTENINAGTSRNTGSDKQTYYKLTLSGAAPDSVHEMAQTLFSGGCMDGDIALCEASLSTQCFLRLVELGVPFPRNCYGEFVGYKTDHDPRSRATSVGPYTSRVMTERLQQATTEKGIKIFDCMQVIKMITENGVLKGVLCLDLKAQTISEQFVLFRCTNLVLATGGPAGIYADSAYPHGHYGSTGIAFEAGVSGKNLTEWQYGLASIKPRWNVSGTYMQALPKFISTDENGRDEKEFLLDSFENMGDMLSMTFLKGYQWPFDVRKLDKGSSRIDLLVYRERSKGRRVFLDFRKNPCGCDIEFSALTNEAYEYLEKAGACFGSPYERLYHMNEPAVDFYKDRGVDLAAQPLEIALCAQHNNGGLDIDCWWQTNIHGLFAVGEVAATHGVYRPGGSALNSGQVGSTRAAQYIAAKCAGEPEECGEEFLFAQIQQAISLAEAVSADSENVQALWDNAAKRMSLVGSAIREEAAIAKALEEVNSELASFASKVKLDNRYHLWKVFRLWDILICQAVYLAAMLDYIHRGGKSRGSALYGDLDSISSNAYEASTGGEVQLAYYKNHRCDFLWRSVRQIPEPDDFFENVWREYRKHKNIG